MLFSIVFERFAKQAPISVRVHLARECALGPMALDRELADMRKWALPM